MAIALSRLAAVLDQVPEDALERLICGGLLSVGGMAQRHEILALLHEVHAQVKAAQEKRDADYFEITGPQPVAGFQFLANRLESAGWLSEAGVRIHRDD